MDLTCDDRPSDSPYIERVWRSSGETPGPFISIADGHWGFAVTRIHGQTVFTVRGPETKATPAFVPPDAEFIGVQFRHGMLMPRIPVRQVMDRQDIHLPNATGSAVWLGSAVWELPTFETMDTFVDRLVRDGVLIHDPVVAAVLNGESAGASLRTIQRRFLQATGMTQGLAFQIERARRATTLLRRGVPILDVVEQAGYFDQPHLTRSLRQFVGQTPAQLLDPQPAQRLSFLYKTPSSGSYTLRVSSDSEATPEASRESGGKIPARASFPAHGSGRTARIAAP